MYAILKSNIGRRILLLVTVIMLPMLAALAVSGWLAVHQNLEGISRESQALAKAVGSHLDYVLLKNLERLENVQFASGIDIEDSDPEPERRALHNTYLGSIFDTVFITDLKAEVLLSEPFRRSLVGANVGVYPSVKQTLDSKKSSISNVFNIDLDGSKDVIMVVTLLRDQAGQVVGLVGGQVGIGSNTLQQLILPVKFGGTSYIDIIDSNQVVLASTVPQHLFKSQSGGQEGVLTEMVSLSGAPWSVAVSQLESESLAPARNLEQMFIVVGLLSLVVVFFLSWGMAQSLVKPIGQLKTVAQNISRGNLLQPVPDMGTDEIGELGQSFDVMRIELKKSLEEIQEWNRQLEAKIEERTRQLHESYLEVERKEAARGQLLQKILMVQEEERKRVARELHDETTQSILGLVMKLEAAAAIPDAAVSKIKHMLTDIRTLAVNTLDNVHKVIFDLRPSVLDDLGLLSAVRWYAQHRLDESGIKARVEVTGEERPLPPTVEISLFRVVQEAITNIIRHAQASNVLLNVEFKDSAVGIEIEDDGIGFDTETLNLPAGESHGVGLLGMRERVELLGGKFLIESQPGRGTRITVEVPSG